MRFRESILSILAIFAGAAAAPILACAQVSPAAPADELQSWIAENAVSLRSIDPADEEFRDLEFLADVIGDAQVVQLGEASHSAGNGFAAKARLVKFLHQRMGFDVLVCEEGIYDMRWIQAGMRGSLPNPSSTLP